MDRVVVALLGEMKARIQVELDLSLGILQRGKHEMTAIQRADTEGYLRGIDVALDMITATIARLDDPNSPF